jgi:DNA processing protein
MKLTRAQIYYYALKYQGDYTMMVLAIGRQELYEMVEERESFLTIVDEYYPQALRLLSQPPLILFYRGKLELLNIDLLAVVGSRETSAYAKQATEWIISGVDGEYGIINGFARGIDTVALIKALYCNRKVIMVMGCGLDYCYPKENHHWFKFIQNQQLMLSEYPQGVKPYAKHFPFRNRIIVALSKAVIVSCAKVKSGTMVSANLAIELHKPLWVVPQALFELTGEGCNLLIAQGANMIINDDDLKVI